MVEFDVIVIGAGASGLMCASEAGKRGRSVLILDHAQRAGNKIRVSGGGRCNFTNLNLNHENYFSQNPHFCISALKRFTPSDFVSLIQKYGVYYVEKEPGQLFCAESSKQILDLLLYECQAGGVKLQFETKIAKIEKQTTRFSIETNKGNFSCQSLVVASGGLSMPTLGASDFGYALAKQFELKIIPPYPALVPLVLGAKNLQDLSGISLKAKVTCGNKHFCDSILFTHRGLSGPAILQISTHWQKGQKIFLDLLPNCDLKTYLSKNAQEKHSKELATILSSLLPKRFVDFMLKKHNINGHQKHFNDLTTLEKIFHQWEIEPSGTEGFNRAEVTAGGVCTDEISSKTFECKNIPGLYFIGEVLDVTGQLGGYNLQWAWSSGHAAGQFV